MHVYAHSLRNTMLKPPRSKIGDIPCQSPLALYFLVKLNPSTDKLKRAAWRAAGIKTQPARGSVRDDPAEGAISGFYSYRSVFTGSVRAAFRAW